MALTDKLTAIGDAIREKTGKEDLIPLSDMPSEINAVYEKGAQSEYDAFWDAYQRKGVGKQYHYAFAGYGWTDETFKPKYDIVMKSSNLGAFQYCNVTDITASLKECKVNLDTSGATSLQAMFSYAATKTLPVIDASTSVNLTSTFSDCKNLERIEKLVVIKKHTYSGTFYNCIALRDISFEGEIGNDINLQYSTLLSKASIESIIGCLSDSTTGKMVTLSKTAVESAFPIEEEMPFYNDPTTSHDHIVNEDGSITLVDRRPFEFIADALPKGTYEVSLSVTEGTPEHVRLQVSATTAQEHCGSIYSLGSQVNTLTLKEDGRFLGMVDITEVDERATFTLSIKKIETWDNLAATKPNWTISLV